MKALDSNLRYIVISPVKDEIDYIDQTIKSMVSQTLRPSKWIIVDDGSTDGTSEIITKASQDHTWIEAVRISRDEKRLPGPGVIRAFNKGYETIQTDSYDFIVKMDCDIVFEKTHYESLLLNFAKNEKLGIASGIYLEKDGLEWTPIVLPDYHAAGAMKVIRKKCFQEIGGFVPARGWDTVDEIKAWAKGWETRHFKGIQFYHLKKEGSGIGQIRTNEMLGEVYYLTGGGMLFLILKLTYNMIKKPYFIGSAMMLWGYLKSAMIGKKLVTEKEAAIYRRILNSRILGALKA
jgi:glycosyltransferase involved in cell wall biosynthesis